MRCNIMFDMELGYFTLNKATKCISYRLSTPRLKFLSEVFGQCALFPFPENVKLPEMNFRKLPFLDNSLKIVQI